MANKTVPTDVPVEDFLNAVEPERRREEGHQLKALFDAATGAQAVMWGPSIVGYGAYRYTLANGNQEQMLATGFSPRKANLSLYPALSDEEIQAMLADLGPHKTSQACLYITRLDKVDRTVLSRIIERSFRLKHDTGPAD